jgi:putative membrane protein
MDTDPDSRARTHLANERTFLAWFRTGITLIALGLAAAQFLTRNVDPDVPLVEILSTLVIGTGAAAVAIGLYHYRSWGSCRRGRRSRWRPAPGSSLRCWA